jgi:hypothetical protein
MLHRHAGHGEAAARITWAITEKALFSECYVRVTDPVNS